MKIYSWNVNGIRATIKKGFGDFLNQYKPDIICLQETKIAQKDIEKEAFCFDGYKEFWNPAERPGYSGVLTLVKKNIKSEKHSDGLGEKIFDCEGRINVLELNKFFLLNVYFPNANHELSRLSYKIDFNQKLFSLIKKLEKNLPAGKAGKPVIVCGDFNVAHEEIDLARPKSNVGSPGFTHEERGWMTKFLQAGFIDTFRYKNKDKIQYSWWSYRFDARVKNIGWRIDYFCVSKKFASKVKSANILNEVYGSDHCPVCIDLKI